MQPPKTQYAKSGGVHIAYQLIGTGSLDLVLVPGWVSHVEHVWELPAFARFLRRLASFCRLIFIDRRGTGLSDRVPHPPTLEERMDDVRAVLDAVGSERAALFGISEGGPLCMLFAATYPQRTISLVLYGTFAKNVADKTYPWAHSAEEFQLWLEQIELYWGNGISAQAFAPSLTHEESFVSAIGRLERYAVSPGGARMLLQMAMDYDVRHVLPSIRVPTLILHRSQDWMTPVGNARYLARHIRGAKYVELPGTDHFAWVGNTEAIIGKVEEFLTGGRHRGAADRLFATVLFADIVDSTERAYALGDRRWRALLQRYYALARREMLRFRGQEIDTAGDGLFASFDGPVRGIRCACSIRAASADLGIAIRTGLHAGECQIIDNKLTGLTVHIGARVAEHAPAGGVLVTATVKGLVAGSGLRFSAHGLHVLKGLPGRWELYVVEN